VFLSARWPLLVLGGWATAGLVALFLLLITLGFKYLPLGGSESDSTSEGGH
jgi:hypothetical protein